MPAPLLSARDWVQAFVHDRIPAVTLTSHIPSHEILLSGLPTVENPV
jgi:hypothetical protein